MDKLQIPIGADNRQLKETLNESKGMLARFGQEVAAMNAIAARSIQATGGGMAMLGVKGAAGVAAAAGIVGAAVIKMASQTAEASVQAGKMAEQYGLNVETFSRLAYAANVNGVAIEDLGQGMKGLVVKMREAANGSEEARAIFRELGVQYVDATGKLRPVENVLADVADAFQHLPDGAGKAALSVKLMEEAGLKLLPVLNQGAEAIRRWGEEAARMGLVVTPEQQKAAKEYEQNMKRLELAAAGLRREVGNEVVPTMAKLSSILLENRGAGLGWWDSFIASITGTKNPAQRVQDLTIKLAELRQKQLEMASLGQKPDAGLAENITRVEKALQHFTEQAAKAAKTVEGGEAESGNRRADLEQKIANKKAEIARLLTYVQTGEGLKIEKAEKERLDRQIADQQRLVDAVRSAWQKSRDEAEKARSDAEKLKADAADIQSQTRQQAEGIRDKGRTPEEVAARKASELSTLERDAGFAAAIARSAAIDGNLQKYAKFADDAEKKLRAALQLAGEVEDATKVEDIGAELQKLKEYSAGLKENEAKRLEETAAAQASTLNELEAQLKRITEQSRAIDVKLELGQAKTALAEFEGQLANLPQKKTVVLEVLQTGSGAVASPALPGFEPGGFTGFTGRRMIAGFVHGQEHVMPAHRTMEPGALAILELWRQRGLNAVMSSLGVPWYFNGGLVSRLAIPSGIRPSGSSDRQPIVLDFGDRRFSATTSPGTGSDLQDYFRLEALKRGKGK